MTDTRIETIETDIRDIAKELRDHKEKDNEVFTNLTTAINDLKLIIAEWRGGARTANYIISSLAGVLGIILGFILS